MFKSIAYVIKENMTNLYRIFCIARYELLADMRDSKFGLFWNFASPAIQVITYWLVFGVGMQRSGYDGIPISSLGNRWLCRVVVHFSLYHARMQRDLFQKERNYEMKFPISVLPATVCVREFFNHLCMMAITVVLLILFGYYPSYILAGTDLLCFLRFHVFGGIGACHIGADHDVA